MKKIALFIFLLSIFSSCSIFKPSIMLRTGKNYTYAKVPENPQFQYKVANNDFISFKIFSNDGFKLIDLTNYSSSAGATANVRMEYLVEHDGIIKLPIIGKTKIAGLTIREAEQMLEEQYAEFYNKPFVMLNVTNRRVIVFAGTGGGASVINLTNNNTTLLEALALAGGISTGKAKRIKLIRGDIRDPLVYLLDLSTIEGMTQANMVIQANDIIYVEPVLKPLVTILTELNPIIGILTSILLIATLVTGTP